MIYFDKQDRIPPIWLVMKGKATMLPENVEIGEISWNPDRGYVFQDTAGIELTAEDCWEIARFLKWKQKGSP